MTNVSASEAGRPHAARLAKRPLSGPGLAALPLALVALTVGLNGLLEGAAGFAGLVSQFHLFGILMAAGFSGLSLVVLRHRPGHAVGLIAAGVGWAFALSYTFEHYGYLGLDRGWPVAEWALWVGTWIWFPGLWAIPTLLALRFPDGRALGPLWRFVEAGTVFAVALNTAGFALTPYGEADLAPLADVANPVASAMGLQLMSVGMPMALITLVACWTGAVVRFRRSRGTERAQMTWALAGLLGTTVMVAVSVAAGPSAALPATLAAGLIPATIGVAILRHRLWDLDVVINRSLVYGFTTAGILAVYVAVVVLLGDLVGRTTGAPVVATAVAALLVLPLREQAQRLASRLRYGDRGDPYRALARLGEQLNAAGRPEQVIQDVTDAVVRALRLRGAAIVSEGHHLARAGELDGTTRQVALTFRGEPVGELLIDLPAGEQLSPGDERLLSDLARHVAVAVHADRLYHDLLASRLRLVTAREEERRRIRHDLHDELGPTLAGVALEMEWAALEAGTDPDAVAARLETATQRLRRTVGDIRALVEGLRPASLDELGLRGAVDDLVSQLQGPGLDITLDVAGDLDGLPAAVEVATYRIVGEALTNVVRHAGASRCAVRLAHGPDMLEITVEDDGAGFEVARHGVGLRSMRERATELCGRFSLASTPDLGTRIEAALPTGTP